MDKFINLLHKHSVDYMEIEGAEIRMNCPECADDGGHFYVNAVKGVGFCHKCGFAAGKKRLYKLLFDELPPSGERMPARAKKVEKARTDLVAINFPAFWKEIEEDHPYMIKRRLDEATIKAYHLGYCDQGDYAQCLIIPTYMDGVLVNYAARDMTDRRKPKYLYPKGPHQSHCLFNYDRARNHSSLVIVEGAMDAMRIGFNAVAVGRKKLSKRQMEFLESTSAKAVFVALDSDATLDALEMCEKMSLIKPTYLCVLPDGKDPDDLDPAEIQEVISGSRFYTKFLKAQVMARQAVM